MCPKKYNDEVRQYLQRHAEPLRIWKLYRLIQVCYIRNWNVMNGKAPSGMIFQNGKCGKQTTYEDVRGPIPRTCEYMTLHDKRNFANVIKWRTLKCRAYVELPMCAQSYHESLNLEDLSLLWSKTETVIWDGFWRIQIRYWFWNVRGYEQGVERGPSRSWKAVG